MVVQKGQALLSSPFVLAPQQEVEFRFGPATTGDYDFFLTQQGNGTFRETRDMGRGGWGVYVTFTGAGVQLSTVHGD